MHMASDKEPFSIDFVLRNASVSEKCSLLAGEAFAHVSSRVETKHSH